ncbi:hypothetical protein LINPERHAP1_LOCUS37380 [Linum perenne]
MLIFTSSASFRPAPILSFQFPIPIISPPVAIMTDTKMIFATSTKLAVIDEEEEDRELNLSSPVLSAEIGAPDSSFSTPKAKEFQIPEPIKCPPPPIRFTKKRYISPSGLHKAGKKVQTARQILLSPEIEAAVTISLLAVEAVRSSPKRHLNAARCLCCRLRYRTNFRS